MTTNLKCPSCGKLNEKTRLFCKSCGAKMDFNRMKFGPSPVLLFFKRLLRTVVLLVLLVVVGFAFWPTAPEGRVGTEEDGRACFDAMADLYEAIHSEAHRVRVIEEEEINAYLETLVAEAVPPMQGTFLDLDLESIRLQLVAGEVVVHIRSKWKNVPLTHVLRGVPVVAEDGFSLHVTYAAMGRLPIGGALRPRMVGRLTPVFANMERERHVLDRLDNIELADGAVRLTAGN